MTDTGLSAALLDRIRALGEACGAQKIVLYGSRARGDYKERSDIDLAVYGLNRDQFSRFTSGIDELPTLLEFDVVSISQDMEPLFLANIQRDGVIIMESIQNKLMQFGQAIERTREGVEEYRQTPGKLLRDGVIQRFEFTAELSWKSCREYLIDQGYAEINSPMSVMKTAYAAGVIDDQQGWIDLLHARNATSHIYSDKQADAVFRDIAARFLPLFEQLFRRLSEA